MRIFKSLALAALIAAGVTTNVLAADAVIYPTPSAPVPSIPAYNDLSFDWSGAYAGIGGVVDTGLLPGTGYGAGLVLGANAAFDFFLVGAEVSLNGLTDGTTSTVYGQVLGRGGLIVTDEVLAYGAVGYGTDFTVANTDHFLVGGGLELAIADDMSLRGQYLHGVALGAPSSTNQFTVGLNYHF